MKNITSSNYYVKLFHLEYDYFYKLNSVGLYKNTLLNDDGLFDRFQMLIKDYYEM